MRSTITWILLLVVPACTVVAAAGASAKSYPVFATAGTLRTWCLGRGAVRASCLGYLAGVVDTLRGDGTTGTRSGQPCLPTRLEGEQIRLLFLNHMHRFPKMQGDSAAAQVREALAAAFPCASAPHEPPPASGKERISHLQRPS